MDNACFLAAYVEYLVVFFFQAEDGIRDYKVTGVQTCALPISRHAGGVDVTEHDPPRSGRLDRGPGMDGQRLQPELRGVADHSRRARRSLRRPGQPRGLARRWC